MRKLTELLSVSCGETATIVGSGGKTSLLWLMAQHYRESKVLVTTTTKIAKPADTACYDLYLDSATIPGREARPGITLAGDEFVENDILKLRSLAPELLSLAAASFDRVLIEGDGSKCLPLKGWNEGEPVVPAFSACTIGVITLWPLGRKADDSLVFRLPLFCAISGASPGDILTTAHVAKAVAHPAGLMKNSRGRKLLFINQVESKEAESAAGRLLEALDRGFLQDLSMVVAGSVQRNEGAVLWAG